MTIVMTYDHCEGRAGDDEGGYQQSLVHFAWMVKAAVCRPAELASQGHCNAERRMPECLELEQD